MAGNNYLKTPYSKMDLAIAELLVKNKFLSKAEVRGRQASKKYLEISFENKPISGLKFVSRPSRRIYIGYQDIRSVKSGYGLLVLSTPKGIMSGQEAKKQKVGGEALFEIW